ncbi:MAG: AmmeMemoRadiSam system protein B [Bacteroidales bacterium]|nr:AmmeMemoRadiSam system protein B [Bacteroidales bacterium]MCF8458558.1 AmmeMemoRadiSam system protein B [Bacteroidales bacterium]
MDKRSLVFGILILALFESLGLIAVAQSKIKSVKNDSLELTQTLDSLFARSIYYKNLNPLAVITPIDDFRYSGIVAASSFNQIDPGKQFSTIFIITPCSGDFTGFSVDTSKITNTLLGPVKMNRVLAGKMIRNSEVISHQPLAHQNDTITGKLLLFLQYHLQKPFTVLPILAGKPTTQSSKELAGLLAPFLNDNNLFVIGTNFSENTHTEEASYIDKVMLLPIMDNSPSGFIRSFKNFMQNDQFPRLTTLAKGWGPLMCLLDMTEQDEQSRYYPILYQNSGESEFGDSKRVTGYHAIAMGKIQKEKKIELSREDQKELIKIVHKSIKDYVQFDIIRPLDSLAISASLNQKSGAFVSLKKHGKLRAVGGSFSNKQNLVHAVQQAAIEAANNRNSFPLARAEADQIEIEISIPSQRKRINSIHEIQLGVHGIYIQKGIYSGWYLPGEATARGWNVREFLSNCAQNKLGIDPSGWQNADIYIFETTVVDEKVLFDVY